MMHGELTNEIIPQYPTIIKVLHALAGCFLVPTVNESNFAKSVTRIF